MSSIVLFSGGMDSTVLLYHIRDLNKDENIKAVSFRYGSKHNKRELDAARKICSRLSIDHFILDISSALALFKSNLLLTGDEIPEGHYQDDSMKTTVVPFRNGIMLAIVAGYAESINIDKIYLANHFGDHAIYPDCRSAFSIPMKDAIKNGTYNSVQLLTPFESINKTDICLLGNSLEVPFDLTWSCYKGLDNHCGVCGTCVERKEAFAENNFNDPTKYEV